MLPSIHRNGTAAQDLLEDNRIAARAVREAIQKLQAAAPNGRDYYPQGNNAIALAIEQHAVRIGVMEQVLQDLDAIARHILDHEDEDGR